MDEELHERRAAICKAFANPVRLKILDLVGKKAYPMSELRRRLGVSEANLSPHLSTEVSRHHRNQSHWQARVLLRWHSLGQASLLSGMRRIASASAERQATRNLTSLGMVAASIDVTAA